MLDKRKKITLLLLCITGILAACGQRPEAESAPPRPTPVLSTQSAAAQPGDAASEQETLSGAQAEMDTPEQLPELDEMQKLFGPDCISEQTFEVQLSEYAQEVYFVPLAPSEENPWLRVRLVRDGQVLEQWNCVYVPDGLKGEQFRSLDEVAFCDVNFDGNTDIIMLETYGETRFAVVDFGYGREEDDNVYFDTQWGLMDNLFAMMKPLTASEICDFLTEGRESGEFADYQEAYEAVSRLCELGGELDRRKYNLIYMDEDNTPELVAGVPGYWVSVYTYHEGRIYCLMNEWGYGAFGNVGYEYVPRKNSLRNYDADGAGAIMNTTYMTVGQDHSMEMVVYIRDVFSEEADENGEYSCTTYVDGVETPEDKLINYDVGEYEFIEPIWSREELLERLGR